MEKFVPLIIATYLFGVSWHFQTRHMLKNWKKYKAVSHMYALKPYREYFKVGLIGTGILQILFALSLYLPPDFYELNTGKYLFIIGGIGAILLGIFSLNENFIIHEIASFQYFIGLAISAVYITRLSAVPNLVETLSVLIVSIWIASICGQIFRKNGVFAIQTIHVLLSYVWIFLISFTVILV